MQTSGRQLLREHYMHRATPQYLLRVGGLPITVLDELNFDQTVQWLNATLSLEVVLDTRKEELVDVLHEAVNMYKEDQALRRKLINFKRGVFNIRLKSYQEEAIRIALLLPPEAADLLNEWIDLYSRHQDLLARGPQLLAREMAQKRAHLKQILTTPDFRKGVLLSSPLLDEAIDAYLASDNQELSRESRTVEHSLLEYLFRTTCKTSPFSTFTPISFGAFEYQRGISEQDIDLTLATMEKQSFTRLNMMLLSRLSTQLLADPEIRQVIPVRLTTGWRIQNGKVKYMRRKASSEEHGGAVASMLDVVQENIIQLPLGPLLNLLIEMMQDGHEERLGELVVRLCVQKRFSTTEEEVERYLQHLLRLSFLIVPAFQLDIHKERPLAAYRESLYATAVPRLKQVADDLGEIERLVDDYATASPSACRAMLAEIKEKLSTLSLPHSTISLPKTLLYEDTALKPQRLAVSSQNWQRLLAQVSELQSLLPALDATLPDRLVMRNYFQRRYGVGHRCDDFLAFADMYNQDFLQLQKREATRAPAGGNELRVRENRFHLPELEQLNEARLEIARYLGQAHASLPPGAQELVLGDDFLSAISALVPQTFDAIQSHTFFSQFVNLDREPLLIINQIYSGLTLMFSRFAYCFADEQDDSIAARLRATLEELQPPGTIFAEVKGGYEATNLNLHPIVTPYELVCPGELSTRPLSEQIELEDLYIEDNAQNGRLSLYSKRLGKEVIPLYLGFLIPLALPEIQQILLQFSYLTMCSLDLWSGTGIAEQAGGYRSYPRLRYKNIVLQRAMWRLRLDQLPRREPGEPDAHFFLKVARWRKALGLPSKVFISPDRSSTIVVSEGTENGREAKKPAGAVTYKPLYVDFENYFSLALLEATIRKANTGLQVTEMLPDRDHLWLKHDGEDYVSEFVFEMNRIRGAENA